MRGDHGRGCRCGKSRPGESQAGGDPGRRTPGSGADGRAFAHENRRGRAARDESRESGFIIVARPQLPCSRAGRRRRRRSSHDDVMTIREARAGSCCSPVVPRCRRNPGVEVACRCSAWGRRCATVRRGENRRGGRRSSVAAWSAGARRRGPAATSPAAPAPRAASRVGAGGKFAPIQRVPSVFGGPGEDGRGLWGYGRWTSEQEEADGTE
jgi:hypothetical protein